MGHENPKYVCYTCIDDKVLAQQVEKAGTHTKCSYCHVANSVEAQGKCPPKCQGKMSSRWIAMLADYDTSDVARAMGGLSAFMYFLTVSLCMPSSRAIPRMDSPLRFAFCTAFHLAI